LARHRKFGNCSHTNEKGCAISAAIGKGELAEHRYKNYIKMKRESEFNDMSYFEKRKKDKDFVKLIKSVQRNKNPK
jgi:ribosome biogenesis GTPase